MPTDDFWEFDDLKDDDIPEYVKHLLEKGSYTDKQKSIFIRYLGRKPLVLKSKLSVQKKS